MPSDLSPARRSQGNKQRTDGGAGLDDCRRKRRRIRATTAHTDDITDNTDDIADNTDDIRQRQKHWKEGDGRNK